MRHGIELLQQYERVIDLGAGRARFIDWVLRLDATYSASQVEWLVNLLSRKALEAENPAAWTMWAIKGPLGAWLLDPEFDRMKRMVIKKVRTADRNLGSPEPIQSLLNGLARRG